MMAAKKEAFGGKQATPFGSKDKKETEKAKPAAKKKGK